MKSLFLGVAAMAMLTGGACYAQTTSTTQPAQPATSQLGTPQPGVTQPTQRTGNAGESAMHGTQRTLQGNQTNTRAASGNDNQAVATTSANAQTPAHGANSFTAGQARTRIEKEGYSNVTDLHKDNNGVWHGKADKDGNMTTVWLDYKGNVGQSKE